MTLAPLFDPPYYAVIFATIQTADLTDYEQTAEHMVALASLQPGYLGIDSARSGVGITVSYWRTLEDIKAWKHNLDHAAARDRGRAQWYQQYTLRIAKVEHNYSFGLP
jgi:heme-degrading monooxygenase HmoA